MPTEALTKPGSRTLEAKCVDVKSLAKREVDILFQLYNRYFAATGFDLFYGDFIKKDKVILLTSERGKVEGFSTLEVSSETFAGEKIRVLFSGDTIIDEAYWGTQALSREFFNVSGNIFRENPGIPLYWLLIVKGHRTFRYLETFYKDYYPCHTGCFENGLKELAIELASRRFGNFFDIEKGVVHFPASRGHLRNAWADIPLKDQGRPNVQYFLKRNPNYWNGDELVCLCKLSPENHRPFARRIFDTSGEKTD